MATMLSVCIPFLVLIMVLQTRPAMEAVRKWGRGLASAGRWVVESATLKGRGAPSSGGEQKRVRRFPIRVLKKKGGGGVGQATGTGGGGGVGVRRSQSGVGSLAVQGATGGGIAPWRRVKIPRLWGWRGGRRREVTEGVGAGESEGKDMGASDGIV